VNSRDDTIEARLRRALSGEPSEFREGVDMSAEAITARIKDLAEMSTLCLELAKVGESR
jgi:hypothetical protein